MTNSTIDKTRIKPKVWWLCYDLNQIPYYTVEVRNKFKGLDLIDRMPDKLWIEVRVTIQETELKNIQRKRNAKRQNGCLRRTYKQLRKEEKGKAKEKRKDTHLNAELQKIARRVKKAFLSDQCKEIQENNRMGKTRDLFKKIRETNGIFQAKMGS